MPERALAVEQLLWCMRPALEMVHLREPLSDEYRRKPMLKRIVRPALHRAFGSILVVTETVNQERAVDRLIASTAKPVPVDVPKTSKRAKLLSSDALREAMQLIRDVTSTRVEAAVVELMETQVYKVAIALLQYRTTALSAYAGILVSTQHSPIIRALIIAAEEQGVPVIYVPHAPVADNGPYLDLPVAYAGLRGVGELEFYAAHLGVNERELAVVGNLASDILDAAPPIIDTDGPGVLALSPDPAVTLGSIFDLLRQADLGEMIVAPHPRSDRDLIRELMPSEWTMFEGGRTLDLLAEGPAFLLQHSSGVAWESAALGIPTATIRLDDAPVNYPFLADESIYPAVRSPEQAEGFAQRARDGEYDRGALREHAARWCAVDGDAAADRLRSLLETVVRGRSGPRLHDGWSAGGGAVSRSWLSGTLLADQSAAGRQIGLRGPR